MMLKTDLVKKIRGYFDLNIYETKVWLALLSKGLASAGEIASISSVPRSRTYDVLESLEKKGFVIAKIGKPVRFIAVKPTVVIEKLKLNTMKNADDKVKILAKLKETREYGELEKLHKSGVDPIKNSELSSAIKGRANIFSHITEMLENAEKEVIIVTNADEVENRQRIFSQIVYRLKKSGIKIKFALNSKIEENKLRELSRKFEIPIRKIDLDARFFVSDGKEMIFMISKTSESEQDTGIWINSDFFVNAMKCMVDLIWEK